MPMRAIDDTILGMSKKLKMSVVIPAYNEEQAIEACLQSLAAQTRPADEIIVVDNNSTDKTAEIAARYARVVTETKQGIGPARTRGFDEATGDVVLRIDSDAVAANDWIAVYEKAFAEDDELIAASGMPLSRIALRGAPLGWLGYIPAFFASIDRNYARKTVALFGFNCAIRKSAWVENRAAIVARDLERTEDTEVSLILGAAGKTKYVPEAKTYFLLDDMSPIKFTRYLIADMQAARYHKRKK